MYETIDRLPREVRESVTDIVLSFLEKYENPIVISCQDVKQELAGLVNDEMQRKKVIPRGEKGTVGLVINALLYDQGYELLPRPLGMSQYIQSEFSTLPLQLLPRPE